MVSQAIIIVSTGRTGTKFFAETFAAHYPQIESHHASRYSTWINILSNAYLDGLFSKQFLTTAWRILKYREVASCTRDIYLDSNNHLFALAVIAPHLYPNAKIIHIIRDPRDYVRSHINWISYRANSWWANNVIPFWQPNPFLTGEMSLAQWFKLSTIERFSWIWDFKNRLIGSIEGSSTPYLRIRFEDIFHNDNPVPHLNKIFMFLGLKADPFYMHDDLRKVINDTPLKSLPTWQNWPAERCARMDALCGELMAKFGYGKENEWVNKVKLGYSLF